MDEARRNAIGHALTRVRMQHRGLELNEHGRHTLAQRARETGIPYADLVTYYRQTMNELFDESVGDVANPPTLEETQKFYAEQHGHDHHGHGGGAH